MAVKTSVRRSSKITRLRRPFERRSLSGGRWATWRFYPVNKSGILIEKVPAILQFLNKFIFANGYYLLLILTFSKWIFSKASNDL
ncbi:hypothetical protein YC2023_100056 [Brassica napus]